MEIKKEQIMFRDMMPRFGSNVMVEGDMIIPDGNPDVREVLIADAVALVDSQEIRNGKVHITGQVRFHILYLPESDDDRVRKVETQFPFTDSVDVTSDKDDEVFISVVTEHIGFSLVNSRKLSLKSIVSVSVREYVSKTIAPITEIADRFAQCRKQEYSIYIPTCNRAEDITVSDILTVPADLPDIDEILKTDARATQGECKTMNGKVMIRGVLHMKTLYSAADEYASMEQVSHDIPFTEIVEARDVEEGDDVCVRFDVKDVKTAVRGDINGDTKIISAEVQMNVTLKTAKTQQIPMLDDCYSTEGRFKIQTAKIAFLEALASDHALHTETQKISLPERAKMSRILYSNVKPILRETTLENGTLAIKGTLVTFMIYGKEDENKEKPQTVHSHVAETDFVLKRAVSAENAIVDCDLKPENISVSKINDTEAEVKATLRVCYTVLKPRESTYITECEWEEKAEGEDNNPDLVIYFVRGNDTLWNIAKKYGTTVEKIKTANHMETDSLLAGSKILIPRTL